jgi:chaperone required for assembly of F1-ATPase
MKKFYKTASFKRDGGDFIIELDGKDIKTPSGRQLIAPTQDMAEAIVQEWVSQEDVIEPDTMPITQLLNTAIDRSGPQRKDIEERVLKYLDTDLLCYQTKEPEELALRQKEQWEPWLVWFDQNYGVKLKTTTDLNAVAQPEDAHNRIRNYMQAQDPHDFTIFHVVTGLLGSVVLALAFMEGELEPEQAFNLAFLEERYHGELANEDEHGQDPAQKKAHDSVKRDLNAALHYQGLL